MSSAQLFPVTGSQPLATGKFVPRNTPGNVAVCLSGGGSRALSAGMGQLQALATLEANGASLFSQARAISTVSGGGWVGIPFVYLQPSIRDSDYLGTYMRPSDLTRASLETLQPLQIGARVTTGFSIIDFALEALHLHRNEGVPADMLWQTLIGIHILQPYGLFQPGSLMAEPAQQRPHLVCNCGMFVTAGGQRLLAPVQSTPFVTGIMSLPPGAVDANKRQVGGGGVTSFAFNSIPQQAADSTLAVQQARPWSLADAAGTSSAAFAEAVDALCQEWAKFPSHLAAAARLHKDIVADNLARAGSERVKVEGFLQSVIDAAENADIGALQSQTDILGALIPAYQYWPVQNVPYGGNVATTEFADGGLLENCGIASVLAYSDIDKIIAFVNSPTKFSKDAKGVIVVDNNIPPLFGFQPYSASAGYVPYRGAANPSSPLYQKNQVFRDTDFQPLLNQMWQASGSGTYQTAPVVSQQLTTVENEWFGVPGGKSVTALWVHLEIASGWYKSFTDEFVRLALDSEILLNKFPHYDTLETELSPTQVNLLSNLSAWTVTANAQQFTSLFSTAASARSS